MSNQPWDRQRHDEHGLEPMLWFGRFNVYLKMGTERSLLGAVNKTVKKGENRRNSIPGSWERNAKKWNWKTRAEAFDLFEMERVKAEFQADADAWRAQRFAGAQKLWDVGEKMLTTFRVVETTVTKDGKTTVIKPIGGVLSEIARVFKMADELARITTRETLPVTKVAPVTPDGKETYDPGASIKDEILSALHSISTASAEKDDN